ncbi:ANTAR domain-containing protein [Nocardioides dongxiaopingii]|nr:ANTAR domain-containing protein [Nocardioides sp. S-1144]
MIHEGASRGTFGASNEISRRIDEYQFTYGEGPCLDAVAKQELVSAPDLSASHERRWPIFSEAVLNDGIHGVFAVPIKITSACVGALDLFRAAPGPLGPEQLAGAVVAAEVASLTLISLVGDDVGPDGRQVDLETRLMTDGESAWGRLAEMDRIEVYQATGMLISQLDVDADEALIRLRAYAIANGLTASQVAWAILNRTLVLERDDHDGPGGGRS